MLRAAMQVGVAMCMAAAGTISLAQTPPSAVVPGAPAAAPSTAIAQAPPDQTVTGGKLHGVVKSGTFRCQA